MTARAFLGIDCGTQSTKALLLDAERGASLAIGRAHHQLIERRDGTREQRPEWWTETLVVATREALSEAGPVEIAGIGVSGQQHGLVALDGHDAAVRPAKLWNDTTTAAECELLTQRMRGPAAVLAATGNAFLPGYTAPKVLWLARHEPSSYAAARRFCLPHDYLNLWLTGSFVTEPGDASGTAYFDARSRTYSADVLGAIDPDRDWTSSLPPVVHSVSVIGGLRQQAADMLGLAAGIPVSAGGGDNMCAAIGVGAVTEGPVVVSLGTSGTAFAYRSESTVDPRGEAAAFCDSTGAWLPLVCTLNCTGATDWIRDLLGLDASAFEAALRTAEPGARGLSFLPYLDGERTPSLPGATGTFAGVRASHNAVDFARAVAEGVTLSLAYAMDALRRAGVEPREITLVGGGAASEAWAQLCADVFELPVLRPGMHEAAAAGAARQARLAMDGATLRVEDLESPRWEPHPSAGLRDAAARAAALRALAVDGRL
jgi:D-xylulose kinase